MVLTASIPITRHDSGSAEWVAIQVQGSVVAGENGLVAFLDIGDPSMSEDTVEGVVNEVKVESVSKYGVFHDKMLETKFKWLSFHLQMYFGARSRSIYYPTKSKVVL